MNSGGNRIEFAQGLLKQKQTTSKQNALPHPRLSGVNDGLPHGIRQSSDNENHEGRSGVGFLRTLKSVPVC